MVDTAIIKTWVVKKNFIYQSGMFFRNQKRTDCLITSLQNRETLIWRVPLIVQPFVTLVSVILVAMTMFLRCVPIMLASPGSIN